MRAASPKRVWNIASRVLGCCAAFSLFGQYANADGAATAPQQSTPPRLVQTPPPELWPGSLKKQLAAVRARCAPVYEAETRVGNLPTIGCETCEPSSAGAIGGGPANPVPRVDDRLVNFHEGSYTRAGAKEASAEFIGCGMRSQGGGGTYLLVDRGGQWQVAGYAAGATRCKTVRFATGRDSLVCEAAYFQGNPIGWNTTLWDFSQPAAPTSTPLLAVESPQVMTVEVCDFPDSGPLSEARFNLLEPVDIDGDGARDVRVEVEYATLTREFLATLKHSATFISRCACAKQVYLGELDRSHICPSLGLPRLRHAQLDFLARGERLVPTVPTARLLQQLSQPRQF